LEFIKIQLSHSFLSPSLNTIRVWENQLNQYDFNIHENGTDILLIFIYFYTFMENIFMGKKDKIISYKSTKNRQHFLSLSFPVSLYVYITLNLIKKKIWQMCSTKKYVRQRNSTYMYIFLLYNIFCHFIILYKFYRNNFKFIKNIIVTHLSHLFFINGKNKINIILTFLFFTHTIDERNFNA